MANFSLMAKLGLDSKGFQTGIDKADRKTKKFTKSVVSLSNRLAKMGLASAAAGFALLSRNAIQLGSYLSDVAESTGFATAEFQVFSGALIDAGGKAENMEKAILLMQKAVVQGAEGMTTYTRAFERLGLSVNDLRNMKPEQQFQTIAKAISAAEDQQGALTAAIEIFGQRNAPRLIEVFKRLDKDGYGKMAADIEKAYGIMDASTQQALDRAADQIERFKNKATIKVGELIAGEGDGAAIKVLTAQLMGAVAKFSVGFLEVLMKLSGTIPTFIGGALEGVANKFGLSLKASAVKLKIALQEGANAVITKFNEMTSANIKVLRVSYRELGEVQKDAAENTGSILETATKNVLKMWNNEPLKGWKDEIDAGTDAITDAYKGDLRAAREAANIREQGASGSSTGGDKPGDKPGDTDEARKKKLEGLEKKIKDMKLEALRAQAEGDKKAEESLNNRVRLGEKIVSIMREFGVSQEEATRLAQDKKQPKPGKADLSGLRGEELAKKASEYVDGGKFEKFTDTGGNQMFRKMVNGWEVGRFTEDQLQAGLQNKIESKDAEKILSQIHDTLKGKFVSE